MKVTLQRHSGIFRYGQKEIPFHYWSHTDNPHKSIDTILFLGSGQYGKIAKWVAANTPVGTVVVESLPHKLADRDANDLREFAYSFTCAAFSAVLKRFGIASAHIMAESQAAPGAVWMILDNLSRVKNVVLIAPLGLTAHILGSTPKERLKELKKRAILSSLQFTHSPFNDWRNFYLNALMFHVALFDTRWRASGQKYAAGASQDMREEYRELASRLKQQGGTLTLILGQRDRMFPPSEIGQVLEKAGINHLDVVTLNISHSCLAIREGKAVLREAVKIASQ